MIAAPLGHPAIELEVSSEDHGIDAVGIQRELSNADGLIDAIDNVTVRNGQRVRTRSITHAFNELRAISCSGLDAVLILIVIPKYSEP